MRHGTMEKRRATSDEDKARRRASLLDAAEALFATLAFPDVKMAEVARRAGVSKGTVFVYFPTKEALFLELLERRLDAWLQGLDRALAAGPARLPARELSQLLVGSLGQAGVLTRLLPLLGSVLELNVEPERVVQFRRWMLERLVVTGGLLEGRFWGLGPGEGVHLLLQMYAIILGLRQLCDPGPARELLEKEPDLAVLTLDFEAEVEILILALLRGREGAE